MTKRKAVVGALTSEEASEFYGEAFINKDFTSKVAFFGSLDLIDKELGEGHRTLADWIVSGLGYVDKSNPEMIPDAFPIWLRITKRKPVVEEERIVETEITLPSGKTLTRKVVSEVPEQQAPSMRRGTSSRRKF